MKSKPTPEWKKAFHDRRELFIQSLRDAVADREVISRIFDEGRRCYLEFSLWTTDGFIYKNEGDLSDAERFLRHLIDQGHKVAYAVSHEGKKSTVLVSFDGDRDDWTPVWPRDFRIDVSLTSIPATKQ